MTENKTMARSVLMIAYTNYRTDPRVIREAEAALEGGFEVDFIALRRSEDPPIERIRGVRVIHLNQERYRGGSGVAYVLSYLEFFVRCFFRATVLQLQRRYRVVHVNNMPDFFVFCALLPKLMRAGVILDIHDPMPDTFASKFQGRGGDWPYRLLLWQERLSAWFADQVITVQEPVKEHVLVAKHGMRRESVQVIANFADDRLFPLRQPTRREGPLRLVFHGTILERYGLGVAMKAIAAMKHREAVRVRIIGEGDYSEGLKALIASLGLGDIVEFRNRMFPLHEIPALLGDCDVGLAPLEISAITNFAVPLKLLEYTSLGMPCVTVRNVAICHYFSEQDSIFYDPAQPQTFTAALDSLIEDPQVLVRCTQRVLALRGHLVWSHEKERYLRLLTRLAR
jgi:glycosyltransferase involved in cell wall biosynthesis